MNHIHIFFSAFSPPLGARRFILPGQWSLVAHCFSQCTVRSFEYAVLGVIILTTQANTTTESGLTDYMGSNESFQTACVFPHNENVSDAAQLVCLGYDKHDHTSHAASDVSHLQVRSEEKCIRVLQSLR